MFSHISSNIAILLKCLCPINVLFAPNSYLFGVPNESFLTSTKCKYFHNVYIYTCTD